MRRRASAVGRGLVAAGAAATMAGCSRLASIPYTPPVTPEGWLRIQPFLEVHVGSRTIVLVQPTTTAIVYVLSFAAILGGVYLLRMSAAQRSRQWWAIALLLWGAGAMLAGTSYEAFSYHIKCAGRDVCAWTSWWEIWYLVASAASIDAILVAHAYSSTSGARRTLLIRYAAIHLVAYGSAVLAGAIVPNQDMISFEMLLMACVPNVAMMAVHHGWRHFRTAGPMDRALLGAWSWLGLTVGAYYVYLASGLTQHLWLRGVWWSENDVLHAGLLVWVGYVVRIVATRVQDQPVAL
jgi:hypothetical protein